MVTIPGTKQSPSIPVDPSVSFSERLWGLLGVNGQPRVIECLEECQRHSDDVVKTTSRIDFEDSSFDRELKSSSEGINHILDGTGNGK